MLMFALNARALVYFHCVMQNLRHKVMKLWLVLVFG